MSEREKQTRAKLRERLNNAEKEIKRLTDIIEGIEEIQSNQQVSVTKGIVLPQRNNDTGDRGGVPRGTPKSVIANGSPTEAAMLRIHDSGVRDAIASLREKVEEKLYQIECADMLYSDSQKKNIEVWTIEGCAVFNCVKKEVLKLFDEVKNGKV
jgi:hypothetical protein